MKTDDVIDEVARRMTTVEARPGLRTRVLASLDAEVRERRPMWIVPASVGAAVCAALVWISWPSSLPVERVPDAIARDVSSPPAPVLVPDVREEVVRSAEVVADARAVRVPPPVAAPIVAPEVLAEEIELPPWDPEPMVDPALMAPLVIPPIEVEPVRWEALTVPPLEIAPLQMDALVIEPVGAFGGSRNGA